MQALILGGGQDVWNDVLRLEAISGQRWEGVTIAINDVAVHWPRHLDHLCSLHSAKLARWLQARAANGYNRNVTTWGVRGKVDRIIQPDWPGGSSGLLAIQVAAALDVTHAVLCGVPMTATPYFAETTEHHIRNAEGSWAHAEKHWRAWEREVGKFETWVRSMSGRTRDRLGEPTGEWLSTTRKGDTSP
jgi:hypothetical protein